MTTPPIPKEVLECWGVGDVARPEPLPTGATANRRFRVVHKYGDAVLFCHLREPREWRLRLELELRHLIGRGGIPVAAALPSRDCDPLVRCEGCWWSLSAWVEGTHYDYDNLEQCRNAGRVLAGLHIPPDKLPLDPANGYDQGVETWLADPGGAAGRLRQYLEKARFGSESAEAHAATFQAWARRIATRLEPLSNPALPRTWTHGDFHGLNLRFRGHQVAGVLDFETSAVRPRIFDLAYAVLMLARTGRGRYRLRPLWVETLLHAYESAAPPLEAREREALHAAMLLSQLPDFGFVASLRFDSAMLAAELARMEWALGEIESQAAGGEFG